MKTNRVIRKMIEERIHDIHTSLPAKIEEYDAKTMYAKVKLLNKKELQGEMAEIPPIVEVPVAHLNAGPFIIRPPYKKGDNVLVIFSEKALDKLLISGDPENPQIKRFHSYDDAIVAKGLKIENDSDLNSSYAEDLLIENQDQNTRWVMKKDGTTLFENLGAKYSIEATPSAEININCDSDVSVTTKGNANIDADGNVNLQGGAEPIPLGNSLKTYINQHTHTGNLGSPTSPPITSMSTSQLSSDSHTG